MKNYTIYIMPVKLTYQYVSEFIEKNGETLISTGYTNNKELLIIKCKYCKENYSQSFDCYFRGFFHGNCPLNQHGYYGGGISSEKINIKTFTKTLRLMEDKYKRSLKYRSDYLPENYNLEIKCWDCKILKSIKVFPNRKVGKYNKDTRCKICILKNSRFRRDNHNIIQIIQTMIKTTLHSTKRRVKNGRIGCSINNITIDDILKLKDIQNNKCAYTGQELVWAYNNKYKASIDRINSEFGYTTNNIQLVSFIANQAKSNMYEDEFLLMIQQIYNYKNKNENNINYNDF